MPTIICKCQNQIIDTIDTDYEYHAMIDPQVTDGLNPYKGEIIREKSHNYYYSMVAKRVGKLILAFKFGGLKEWLEKNKLPDDMTDKALVYELIRRASNKIALKIYQCSNCERIYIEKSPRSSVYHIFKPETEETKGVLDTRLPPSEEDV